MRIPVAHTHSCHVPAPCPVLLFALFRRLLQHVARDLGAAEQIVCATSLDWTIARPPRLVETAAEAYRSRSDALPKGRLSMSFRAVAAFMLDAVELQAHLHEVVGLAS
jgi:uncharacterized protein YbjT (DUF2867 family)